MNWQATSLGDSSREVVTTPERLAWWETRLIEASRTGLLSWDTETSGLKWWAGSHHPKAIPHCLRSESPRIIGHCAGYWEGDRVHAAYFPIRHEGMERQLDPEKVTAMSKEVLSIRSAQVVFHNAKFDLHFLRKDGVEVGAFIHDSMIMAALVDEHGKKSLEVLSEKYGVDCGGLDAKKIVLRSAAIAARRVGLLKREWPGYALVPISVLGPYGAGDAESTLYLGTKLLDMVRDNWWGLYATEMVVLRRLFEAEETGMGVDVPVLQGIADQAEIDSEKAYGSLVQVAGVFNPSQDDAVRERLFGYLKAPHTKFNKKTQVHKVDAKELSKLWHMHHDPRVKTFISSLLAWRKANKLKTTYSTSLIAMVDPNGRLHTDFRQCEAETGRMASANPNFQNFPNDGLIRSAFTVPEGWVRVYLDYSQVELRILAYCTGDPAMVRAFVAGEDLHSMTSMELFGSAEKEFRKKAKTINFGLSYGMTPLGFLLDMCLDLTRNPPTLAEAEEYFDAFHKKFPAMDRWARGLYRNMLNHQVPAARNIFGRTRRLPLLRASSNYERGRAERKAVSSAIQGTSADIIKHALGQDRFLEVLVQLGGKLVNIVHDEFQVDFPRENALEGATRLKVIMEDYPIFRPIPILADGQWSATNWKEKTQIWV